MKKYELTFKTEIGILKLVINANSSKEALSCVVQPLPFSHLKLKQLKQPK